MWVIDALLVAVLIFAAVTDIRERLIYNIVPILVVLLFGISLSISANVSLLPSHLGSFSVAALIGIGLFSTGIMGGGDVKLFAALALHYPLSGLADLGLAIAIFGALVGLFFALLTFVGQRNETVSANGHNLSNNKQRFRYAMKTPVPYGCAILLGHLYIQFL